MPRDTCTAWWPDVTHPRAIIQDWFAIHEPVGLAAVASAVRNLTRRKAAAATCSAAVIAVARCEFTPNTVTNGGSYPAVTLRGKSPRDTLLLKPSILTEEGTSPRLVSSARAQGGDTLGIVETDETLSVCYKKVYAFQSASPTWKDHRHTHRRYPRPDNNPQTELFFPRLVII